MSMDNGTLRDEDALLIGRIVAAHGIRGWVKVLSMTSPRENIFAYQPWYLRRRDGGWEAVRLLESRPQGKGLVARLEGCQDRTQVEQLMIGRDIAIHRATLPPAAADEIYWRDLIGMRVRLADGRDLGVLRSMFETGANEVIVVQGDGASIDRRERLIPWAPGQVIGTIDTDARTLQVDWDPEF